MNENVETNKQRAYIAIDLKSFYASVECMDRGLDPLTTNLVVADAARTEKTICLAVTPSLKAYGISGRARLFEVVQRIKAVNDERRRNNGGHLSGRSSDDKELKTKPQMAVDYIVAPPRMAHYLQVSTQIYQVYLKYIAPEDMHIYSIDEVFIDATHYLSTYKMTPKELARKMILDVLETTGITATAGIGPNMYLCKVAMDIVAKRLLADENGVRIAELDEMSYRYLLWEHRPLTDFWRVGRGYARRLEEQGLYTMGDIARCSIGDEDDYYNEDLLYKMFGVNAELLIDHAWGWEPCTIKDVKAYEPENNSISSGQVLQCAYTAEKARLVLREMADMMVLDLVEKGLVTDQIVITVGYDIDNLKNPEIRKKYKGEFSTDYYGRVVPKHAHGTINLKMFTSSTKEIVKAVEELYDEIVNPRLWVRRLNIVANHVMEEALVPKKTGYEQLNLFIDYETLKEQEAKEHQELVREKKIQHAMLDIKKRYGKNAILKGMNFEEGATARERNNQIGGHKA